MYFIRLPFIKKTEWSRDEEEKATCTLSGEADGLPVDNDSLHFKDAQRLEHYDCLLDRARFLTGIEAYTIKHYQVKSN